MDRTRPWDSAPAAGCPLSAPSHNRGSAPDPAPQAPEGLISAHPGSRGRSPMVREGAGRGKARRRRDWPGHPVPGLVPTPDRAPARGRVPTPGRRHPFAYRRPVASRHAVGPRRGQRLSGRRPRSPPPTARTYARDAP
ncbi:hypothetical protein GTZ89_30755 [Streptomyces sp. SID8382]|nr:hypothetical protein [Streptomyces sp. SID8382]